MRAGELARALEKLDEVLAFDVGKLAKKPWLKPRVESVLRRARELREYVKAQLEAMQRVADSA